MAGFTSHPNHIRQPSKSDFTCIVRQAYDKPPPYKPLETPARSSYNPKPWSLRRWLILSLIATVTLVIVIVVAVKISRANRYPDYSRLNYRLAQTYSGESFFDNFNYFSGYDPAQGFVHYAAREAAIALNLTYANAASAILRVDVSNTDTTTGRISARVESKTTYNSGLFVFDIVHSPYGCSTWPALWLTDPSNWPLNGEIDVVEAANTASTGNQVALHSTDHCSMEVKRKQTGNTLETDCYNATNGNSGCGVRAPTHTVGREFNTNGGGIYALEWRGAGIRVWFFDRSNIPIDLSRTNLTDASTSPDPNTWGTTLADFPSTSCNIASHFKNQSIIANIDLCGQWAGVPKLYSQESNCPGTCVEFVSTQPGTAYKEAYWEFGGFWVFQAV